jgi:DNA-binding transcriptional ArsR family regulator
MSEAMVFRALADPARREILEVIRVSGPQRAGDIAGRFDMMTRNAVSKHLRVLREAELITQVVSDDGRERIYDLQAEGMEPLREWVARYETFWADRLSRLKQLAEAREKNKRDTQT